MSRVRSLAQLDCSSLEALRRDLGRLVAAIDLELDERSAERPFEWHNVTPLQRGEVRSKFGQLVRMDTMPGNPAPKVYLPEAVSVDVGKSVGVSANNISPTGVVRLYPAGTQKINYAAGVATLGIPLGIRDVVWTGQSWEVRL